MTDTNNWDSGDMNPFQPQEALVYNDPAALPAISVGATKLGQSTTLQDPMRGRLKIWVKRQLKKFFFGIQLPVPLPDYTG